MDEKSTPIINEIIEKLLYSSLISSLILILLGSCVGSKSPLHRSVFPVIESETFKNQFTGILILNAETRDTLVKLNSDKYFTPASNTKIFTLFAALSNLPEKIPALKYLTLNDTTYIEGTGDPTPLHPFFSDSTVLRFLKGKENVALYLNNFRDERYGPGWAWEDYQYYFQPERSGLPLYGNVASIFKTDYLQVFPQYFRDKTVELDYIKYREENQNQFYYNPSGKDTLEIPFKIDSSLIRVLLEASLNKKLRIANLMPNGEKSILYSIPSDSVYKRMMLVSDNFLAEQLMLLVSSSISDTLNFKKAKDYVLTHQLSDLKQPPNWVDGSGLSRYNLFTPGSMVDVLYKMYTTIPKEKLFGFFPAGGESGTLKNRYGGDRPYIYAKTGSLENNYCLSGYLLTKSGKILIFSFMNNHFLNTSSEIKERMQSVFETIRDTY